MDDWLNLMDNDSRGRKSWRGPLFIVVCLLLIALAFFLLYKVGRSKLENMKPAASSSEAYLARTAPLGDASARTNIV
ncbi:MAG: hypothetical protein LBJ64_02525 [Deltaproteobacteria bacterium]|jgi:hypothetical protein|nr:hypothetical protein [Deltaproteobacteria bacterium]